MSKIRISKDKCKGCQLCAFYCPKGLICESGRLTNKGIYTVEFKDTGECTGCGFCRLVCPDWAIEIIADSG